MVWVRLAAQPFLDSKLCFISPLDGAMDVYTFKNTLALARVPVSTTLVKWPLMHQEACNESRRLHCGSDLIQLMEEIQQANISLAAVH